VKKEREEGDDLLKWVNGCKQKKASSAIPEFTYFLRKNVLSPLRMTSL